MGKKIGKSSFGVFFEGPSPPSLYQTPRVLPNLAPYPGYQPAQLCKRIIVNPGYLGSLHSPNVTSTYDKIKRVMPEGVQLKTSELVPLDVLIS